MKPGRESRPRTLRHAHHQGASLLGDCRARSRLRGRCAFPGTYPISEDETLSSVIQRAGGLTPYAFAQGAVFTRVAIREEEQQQIDQLAQRMQSELTTVALQSTQGEQGQNAGPGARHRPKPAHAAKERAARRPPGDRSQESSSTRARRVTSNCAGRHSDSPPRPPVRDRNRRSAEATSHIWKSGLPGRLHPAERRPHPARGQEPHLHGPRRRQRRGPDRTPMVQQW